jgi:hypothetical protein
MSVPLLLILQACVPAFEPGDHAPDFVLPDVNPASPTGGTDVAVSDQRGRVSAWYFGHST